MIKNTHDGLISALENTLPPNKNIANALLDILPLGKEAVYRRLRGHVQFTLDEAVIISKELGISLDEIAGIKDKDRAVFGLRLLQSENLIDKYCEVLNMYTRIFLKLKDCHSKVIAAFRIIPYSFVLPFSNLSKFKLYRWIYQTQAITNTIPFSELIVPQKVIDAQKRFIDEIRFITYSYFIFDRNMFTSFAREINYFAKQNLISDTEVQDLKSEIFELLSVIELTAATGTYSTGKSISLYLSDVDFDASYAYFKGDDIELSLLSLYSIGIIDSENPYVCQSHKEWIESLRRFSTLITQSGEKERKSFFKIQKELINNIL
ncbi:hypothetical protein [Dysgonomonas sp. ZJ709]|uniref:hypothetical protein n=1 Tax=Dysgonomonas sp. ZJ709 TaxID=2709797 RepID=UPI0013EDD55C|nr:hypothetical protein [Dysgonomonas sp. ZJ709]